jgi:hypothetical protein
LFIALRSYCEGDVGQLEERWRGNVDGIYVFQIFSSREGEEGEGEGERRKEILWTVVWVKVTSSGELPVCQTEKKRKLNTKGKKKKKGKERRKEREHTPWMMIGWSAVPCHCGPKRLVTE